ncbi:hypothetical protein [Blastopirellula retiformator]|uniref:Uncharacterized protein n=1 Tax=Blastopirellula retiformator TaxID=2527970 RepID=A0A5C5VLP2_9BACT|nr:hypothetical protein [Blastopirellula retiformator]TWT38911.1 hypothetical protein Enr8_06050 [Blastopirellula retiformator]
MSRYVLAVALIVSGFGVCPVSAAQPVDDEVELVDVDELYEFGQLAATLATYRPNPYLYRDEAIKLQQIANELVGREVEFTAGVRSFKCDEVLINVSWTGRTNIAMQHNYAPMFGNNETLVYEPMPRRNLFVQPVGLRIGEEIPLSLVRKLNVGDGLVFRGTIIAAPTWLTCDMFAPRVGVVVADWKIVAANNNVVEIDLETSNPN